MGLRRTTPFRLLALRQTSPWPDRVGPPDPGDPAGVAGASPGDALRRRGSLDAGLPARTRERSKQTGTGAHGWGTRQAATAGGRGESLPAEVQGRERILARAGTD